MVRKNLSPNILGLMSSINETLKVEWLGDFVLKSQKLREHR